MHLYAVSVTLVRRGFFWDTEESQEMHVYATSEAQARALVECQIELTRRVADADPKLQVIVHTAWLVQ